MNHQRRVLLKRSIQAGAAFVILASPSRLWAKWPASAFDSSDLDSALAELGADPESDSDAVAATESDLVVVDAPEEVDNAAIVAIRVSTSLADVESISILVEDNQIPLAGRFAILDGVTPRVSTRIRLEQSGRIVALVKTANGYYLNGATTKVKPFLCQPVKVKKPVQKPAQKSVGNTGKSQNREQKAEAKTE